MWSRPDQTYQTIVVQLIWLSGLGRFDIAEHIMTMSRFRQQHRIGHLDRLKKIIGYLANFPHGSLRFSIHEPDYSNLPHIEYDWQRTIYAGANDEIPHDIPEPKGKHVTTTTYVDANLHHDQVTGRAVTASLHLVNATLSHWHTKIQAAVETATIGSEFVSARIATDLLTSGTHKCILEFQLGLKATCLVTTDLWLTVQASLHLPYQRN